MELGDRQLLHEMTELHPTGYEESPFFLFLFLQCLPKEVWIVLGDVQATATQADKLWSLHNHQQHGFVVSVNLSALPSATVQPSATIAAIKSESSSTSSQLSGLLSSTLQSWPVSLFLPQES